MSKILNDIVANSISINECLQRLLVIANKTNNKELADWCFKELNGYKNKTDIPDYRKFKSNLILYSGINGRFKMNNQPMQPGFLSQKTLERIEPVWIFEGISDIEKKKESDTAFSRDLTVLASEVFKRTKDNDLDIGVQCTSISQVIPQQFYEEVHSAIKTRIINLLCSFEKMGIDLDNLDIKKKYNFIDENAKIYQQIIIQGNAYLPEKQGNKVLWNIIVPIITGVISAIVSGMLVYLITNVWMK